MMISTNLLIYLSNIFTYGITPEILVRLGLSVLAGTLLGIERERHGRAAGLRTTMLVCVASCIAMLISDGFYRESYASADSPGGWHPDPARLAAGVLAGMGFLGAGVIIHQTDHMVRGVTTAATLWFVTMIGLAFGSGSIGIGVIGTASALAILMLVPLIEQEIKNDWYSDLEVQFISAECSVAQVVAILKPLGVKVKGIDLAEDLSTAKSWATFHLRYKRQNALMFSDNLTSAVKSLKGVTKLSLKS